MSPRRIPHVFVLIFGLTAATALASLWVPGGAYERDADDRVVAGTFAWDTDSSQTELRPRGAELFLAVLEAPLRGIDEAGAIIAFILVLGGAFRVMEATGAFDAALRIAVHRLRRARIVLIPILMLLFSIGGAVFGMSEEIIPFVLLLVPLVRALGYHPMLAVAIPVVGSQVGFAGAMVNPFTVGLAQAIAGLPPLSGWAFRTVLWCVVTTIGIAYVVWWSLRAGAVVEPDPDAPDDDDSAIEAPSEESAGSTASADWNVRHQLVLGSLVAGIAVVLWGIERFEWYVTEIGAIFLLVGLVSGFVGGLGADRTARAFASGARDLVTAALVVGVARGIVVLAQDTRILDPILHGAAVGLGQLPRALALNLMFVFQTGLNFFLPSGSGQAALTMPIMAPLAELVGLTRQMAVLAFQLGDGFSNMIIPTSAVLMGSLEAGKIRYESWFRFILPLQLVLLGVGFGFLTLAAAIGYGP